MPFLIIAAAVVISFFVIVFGSFYTVDEGSRGVTLRNGAVTGIATPGLSFKFPLIDDVEEFSVQSRKELYENLQAYSRDQQPATLRVSVNYRLLPDKVDQVYSDFGSESAVVSRLIQPKVFQELKTIFGGFNAETSIRDRSRLNLEVNNAVSKSIEGGPVVIDSVQIENIDFSKAYEESVEQRMLAEVEVQKVRQNAEREKVNAEITVTRANAEADSVKARAQGEADAIRLRGNAEAEAITARAKALGDNPNLVKLVEAEKWDGKLPTTILPNGATPIIGLK